MWVGVSRAEIFNEVNRAMWISRAFDIQIIKARLWECTLHSFFLSHYPSYLSFLYSASKNQFDETVPSLNLVWFQEEQNFICDTGKISLHGENPNGKFLISILCKESCHHRLCPSRRERREYPLCKMCVCMCMVTQRNGLWQLVLFWVLHMTDKMIAVIILRYKTQSLFC